MPYAHLIEKLPEELRFPMLELVEGVEETLREKLAVRREDFVELRVAVGEQAQAQARIEQGMTGLEAALQRLAEAQARTEERVGRLEEAVERLAEAQDRTDATVRELAEAQKRTDAAVRELAEAQKHTDAAVRELAEAQKHTDDRLTRFEKTFHASTSALGARWDIRTEDSFRNAIQSILADFTDLQVEHFSVFDPAGEVFGRPDQVEIDVVIRKGQTIIGEIKSSMSRGDVHLFDRKVKFYERLRGVNVNRKMIITPMLDYRARTLVDELGITVYSSAYDFGEET